MEDDSTDDADDSIDTDHLDHVDDGGGCAEMWEVTSASRRDDSDDDTDG